MSNENKDASHKNANTAAAQELLNVTFSHLKDLGDGEQSSRLFPNGIASVDLEVELGTKVKPNFRVALRITGGASSTMELPFTATGEEDQLRATFNAEGHHVIALIAMQDLEVNSPTIFQKVERILAEGGRTIFEAAKYPDDIRLTQPQTKPFHYVDIPLKNGGPSNPPLPNEPHVLSKIVDFTKFLNSGGGNSEQKVNALSWLIHLFGDIHQPLHCIERFNVFNPSGDRGGNGFKLKGHPNNLHSLWDSSVNVFRAIDDRDLAIEIMHEHTRKSLTNDLKELDTEWWARASFRLAKRYAYSSALVENPNNPPKPSLDYLRRMEQIGRRQAARGGYRLSSRLKEIFESV
jgi:hypothetical protein